MQQQRAWYDFDVICHFHRMTRSRKLTETKEFARGNADRKMYMSRLGFRPFAAKKPFLHVWSAPL